jgi:MFS family permease
MSCAGIIVGALFVLRGLIAGCTGSLGSEYGRKGLLREEHPCLFRAAVISLIVLGVAIILWASTHPPTNRH